MKIIRSMAIAIVVATAAARPVLAQQTGQRDAYATRPMFDTLIVKTVPLHHLTSAAAAKLLFPYSRTVGGGVFEAPTLSAVTIKETQKIFAEMMTILAQYDRDPATVTLNFQLIAAENTNTRDPNLSGLDSLLRGVLKFSGYRLLTTSVISATEFASVSQTLAADGEPMNLAVGVTAVQTGGADGTRPGDASVHLTVYLQREAAPARGAVPGHGASLLLSTGVTVPIGQTVVLGTSAPDGAQRALILTVRPQLTTVKK